MITDIKDTAYLIVSNVRVEKVCILSENNGMYTVKLSSTWGAIRVGKSRLYSTQEEAETVLKERKGNEIVTATPKKAKASGLKSDLFHSPHYLGW